MNHTNWIWNCVKIGIFINNREVTNKKLVNIENEFWFILKNNFDFVQCNFTFKILLLLQYAKSNYAKKMNIELIRKYIITVRVKLQISFSIRCNEVYLWRSFYNSITLFFFILSFWIYFISFKNMLRSDDKLFIMKSCIAFFLYHQPNYYAISLGQ